MLILNLTLMNQEITLSPQTDPFYRDHMFSNFGDLGEALKEYVTTYKTSSASTQEISSVADMKRFVEAYPEIRKLGGNVSKHVALVGELSRLVGRDCLLEVSEVEQGLAAGTNSGLGGGLNADLRAVKKLVEDPRIQGFSKLRVCMIFALRYQRWAGGMAAIKELVELLVRAGVDEKDAKVGIINSDVDLLCSRLFFRAACLPTPPRCGCG